MSEQLLGTVLNKHFSIRCSDWEAEDLSAIQVKYAAQDAIASIAICLKLVAETRVPDLSNMWSINNMYDFYTSWVTKSVVPDTKFRMPSMNKNVGTLSNNLKEKKILPTKQNKYILKFNVIDFRCTNADNFLNNQFKSLFSKKKCSL